MQIAARPIRLDARVKAAVHCSRLSTPITHSFRAFCERTTLICHAGKGSVTDAPATKTTAPTLDNWNQKSQKRPPIYKLMLHNDNYNKRDYVVKVLMRVVDGITVDDAVVIMQEAHNTGVAMVLACPQEEAEEYCESLRLNGLYSSIEPGC